MGSWVPGYHDSVMWSHVHSVFRTWRTRPSIRNSFSQCGKKGIIQERSSYSLYSVILTWDSASCHVEQHDPIFYGDPIVTTLHLVQVRLGFERSVWGDSIRVASLPYMYDPCDCGYMNWLLGSAQQQHVPYVTSSWPCVDGLILIHVLGIVIYTFSTRDSHRTEMNDVGWKWLLQSLRPDRFLCCLAVRVDWKNTPCGDDALVTSCLFPCLLFFFEFEGWLLFLAFKAWIHFVFWTMTSNGTAPSNGTTSSNGTAPSNGASVKKPVPKFQSSPLNQRILSTMERRTVAAHPWHDLEIGELNQLMSTLLLVFALSNISWVVKS